MPSLPHKSDQFLLFEISKDDLDNSNKAKHTDNSSKLEMFLKDMEPPPPTEKLKCK